MSNKMLNHTISEKLAPERLLTLVDRMNYRGLEKRELNLNFTMGVKPTTNKSILELNCSNENHVCDCRGRKHQ